MLKLCISSIRVNNRKLNIKKSIGIETKTFPYNKVAERPMEVLVLKKETVISFIIKQHALLKDNPLVMLPIFKIPVNKHIGPQIIALAL